MPGGTGVLNDASSYIDPTYSYVAVATLDNLFR
jgi:hypothetical protein